MLKSFIHYFATRHLLTNILMIMVFVGGVFFWFNTPKEELPNVDMNFVRIRVAYPGSTAVDMEYFVVRPIEEKLQEVDSLYKVESTAAAGTCSIMVEIDPHEKDMNSIVTDIRGAVNDANLPLDLTEDPNIRQFKTSKKAIVDVGIFDTSRHLLDDAARKKLQAYALSLENKLLDRPEINSANRKGYLKEEFHIELDPAKLRHYNISVDTVLSAIKDNNLYRPAGSLENKDRTRVTLYGKVDSIAEFNKIVVQAGFEGHKVRIADIATVKSTFEKKESILKIEGHEGLIFNVVKNSSYGILKALDAVHAVVKDFEKDALRGTTFKIALLDDEAKDVRNRISIISMNGAIGFILIFLTLLIFLNFRSSLWVALGIPFSFCFTMVIASVVGLTINNVTLAAVIIVMGMVVDDAIVVAENITRLRGEGKSHLEAAIEGTAYVLLPILASVITTCVAFLPLLASEGRFAKFNQPIPIIISIMLLGSLVESIIILPAHMNLHVPRWLRIIFSLGTLILIEKLAERKEQAKQEKALHETEDEDRHWFLAVEERYERILLFLLGKKKIVLLVALAIIAGGVFVYKAKFKFVMFPREEATEIMITGDAGVGTKLLKTADIAKRVENIFQSYMGKEVTGYRTHIGEGRFGRLDLEHKFTMRVEIVPMEQREKSLRQLLKEWKDQMTKVKGIKNIRYIRHRFGQTSGSPIEVIVRDNNDTSRDAVVAMIIQYLKKKPVLKNIESDKPLTDKELKMIPKRDIIGRLGISPLSVDKTLRTMVDGSVLYELIGGDDTINVRVTSNIQTRRSQAALLRTPVVNKDGYLVPLGSVVTPREVNSATSISRMDFRRVTKVYANFMEGKKVSPLEVAADLEKNLFPVLSKKYPTSTVSFGGEIKDTRESRSDFKSALLMVILFIYAILAIILNSLIKPLIIMMSIPFSTVGIIYAFWLHGMAAFGFFTVIGVLGLAGVAVNDSIILMVKLEDKYDDNDNPENRNSQVASITKTRLRAVLLTTFTTVAGLLPTAYGVAGYDSMLSEMMLAMSWGLLFSTLITLIIIPTLYSVIKKYEHPSTGSG